MGSSLRKASASWSSTSDTTSTSSRRFAATNSSILAGTSALTTFSLKGDNNRLSSKFIRLFFSETTISISIIEQTHWNHESIKTSYAQDPQDPEIPLPTQLELALQHCDAEALTLPTK